MRTKLPPKRLYTPRELKEMKLKRLNEEQIDKEETEEEMEEEQAEPRPPASFTTLPTEVCDLIIKEVIKFSNLRKRLLIPCCQEHWRLTNDTYGWSGKWKLKGPGAVPVAALRDVYNLMRVNRQLSQNVRTELNRRLEAMFCVGWRSASETHEHRDIQVPIILGLGQAHSAYRSWSTSDASSRLAHSLRNFGRVLLDFRIAPVMFDDNLNHLRPTEMIHQQLAMKDHLHSFVHTLNSLPSITKVGLCCTIVRGIDGAAIGSAIPEHLEVSGATKLKAVFDPFEDLDKKKQLIIHVHVVHRGVTIGSRINGGQINDSTFQFNDRDIATEEMIQPVNGFPSNQQSRYLRKLEQKRQVEFQACQTSGLIDEWIHLRAWAISLLSHMDPVPSRKRNYRSAPSRKLVQGYIQDSAAESRGAFNKIILNVWLAHRRGNRKQFNTTKAKAGQWWIKHCQSHVNTMIQEADRRERSESVEEIESMVEDSSIMDDESEMTM